MAKVHVVVSFAIAATVAMAPANAVYLRTASGDRVLAPVGGTNTKFFDPLTQNDKALDSSIGNTKQDGAASTAPTGEEPSTATATVSIDEPAETPATTDSSSTSTDGQTKTNAPAIGTSTSVVTVPIIDVTHSSPGDSSAFVGQFTVVPPWKQCGGANFDYSKYVSDGTATDASTKLDCMAGYTCEVVNPSYYQCRLAATQSETKVELYGQCGGIDYTGPTKCSPGSVCKANDQWYSQCVPQESD